MFAAVSEAYSIVELGENIIFSSVALVSGYKVSGLLSRFDLVSIERLS